MSHLPRTSGLAWRWRVGVFSLLAWAVLGPACAHAAKPPTEADDSATQVLTRETAIGRALQNNPALAALRQQHGIAAAGVVIARTYPFNPVWEGKVRAASGPEGAGITNRVSNEHLVLLEVEARGQGVHRRDGAAAALSRTDWEIAFQELDLAVRTARAFDTVLYRQQKLQLIQETVQLNERAAAQVSKLVEQSKLRPADLIVIRTEVLDSRAQTGPGRAALLAGWADLRRALGVLDDSFSVRGTLEAAVPRWQAEALSQTALERRPDLHARQAGVGETEARLRLEIANRYGNPTIGPAYEYDASRVNLIGVQFLVPLPVFNKHRGEILQRQAERDRALLELRALEIQVRQDVRTGLRRVEEAQQAVKLYRDELIPSLKTSLEAIEKLFVENEPGVDVVRVLDVRRKLLKARDGYLDALWEASQARADLAAAVGDPGLADTTPSPPPKPYSP